MFYLGAFILLASGAAFVILALRRGGPGAPALSREKTVAALYQDRLDELRAEMARGQAEVEDRDLLEAELGAALLSDYDALAEDTVEPAVDESQRGDRGLTLALASAGLLIALALLVYAKVGDPEAMQLAGAESVLQLDAARDQEALSDWRLRLTRRVDDRPGDGKSWYLLGHVDLKLGQFASAAEAFAMANAAHGDDPSIDVFWLQARYMAAGGQIDATTRSIAERILTNNPNQPLVLEMYAIDAYRQGNFRDSVSLLNRALSGSLAANHRAALSAGFQEARNQLGDLPVTLDVEIQAEGQPPGGATLFVIARPIGGGMPFAVVRRPAGELPRTIRLDDAVSMNPAAPLSNAVEVEVVVRLSRTGTAMAHPGDWEWHSDPVMLADLTAPLKLRATLKPPG